MENHEPAHSKEFVEDLQRYISKLKAENKALKDELQRLKGQLNLRDEALKIKDQLLDALREQIEQMNFESRNDDAIRDLDV